MAFSYWYMQFQAFIRSLIGGIKKMLKCYIVICNNHISRGETREIYILENAYNF